MSHIYLELESQFTLHQVLTEGSWAAAWNKTGVLGKQALLQILTHAVSNDPEHPLLFRAQYTISPCDAEKSLKTLLAAIEMEGSDSSAAEAKAYSTYQLMILSALMSHNTPRMSLLATAMRIRYQRFTDKEYGELTKEWNKAPRKRRRAVLYAAQTVESVQGQYCVHFSTPVLLFRATLTLWLYTLLDKRFADQKAVASLPSVVLGGLGMSDSDKEKWVESGIGRVKLKGVGSIFTPEGRRGLLDKSISAMRSIKSWGISKIYEQLLSQLQEV